MTRLPQQTGYAQFSPQTARIVLAVSLALTVACVAITLSPLGTNMVGRDRAGEGDIAAYRAEIERVHLGEGYYEAAAAELAARGYPTRSVFNWRTPLPMWLIGKLPAVVLGKAILGILALAVMLMGFEALAREQGHGLGRPLGYALLLTGPMMPCVLGGLYVLPVLWAGVLIAASIGAYGINRRYLGVAFGLAAVFFRDLALPYCVLATGLAWWEGRRKEVVAWVLGLAAWCLFFSLHWLQVQPLIGPDAQAHEESWIQFGGMAFIIATTQMNAYLLLMPQWVTALYFAAGMLGFAGWNTPLGRRVGLSVCLYVLAFAVAGHDFNQYWGALCAPLWCFGVVRAPASVRDLLRASGLAAWAACRREPHASVDGKPVKSG
jgi:hypothetical protein